jgi:arylformamidase
VLSARGSYVKLSGAEVRELSPQHQVDRMKGPVVLAYAEHDTDEFQRQTQAFAAALEGVGRLSAFLRLPALNHFEIIEALVPTDGPLFGAILAQMGAESLESARPENDAVDRTE